MTTFKTLHAILIVSAYAAAVPASAQEIPVSVRAIGETMVANELQSPATVISANRADLTSEVAALIRQVHKDVGDEVTRGQRLVTLDDANARFALEQARASLAAIDAQIIEAQSRLRKAEELLDKAFISDEELIARRANLAVLEANRQAQLVAIDQAELELKRTRIDAPYDAAVVARQAQVGSYAQPGTPLMTIVQTDQREVDVELDPRHAPHISQVKDFRFSSQGREWAVRLARVSGVIDSASRVVRARFVFDGDVAPIGASGQLRWSEASRLVPVEFIVQRGRDFGVFVANDSHARFVAIPSAQEGRPAEVDLPPETLLVIRGHTRLQDGDALDITRE